jgi:ferritin-like metal-binding protein YciE
VENLQELFVEQLKDLYSAEKQLTKALPKMAKAATSAALRAAFTEHLAVTKEHVSRIEAIFNGLAQKPGRKKCAAMEGLIAEGQELLDEKPVPAVMDAGLIAAAQRVEHYEIAAYGTASTFAKVLGHKEAAWLLEKTLKEEGDADKALTSLAKGGINQAAISPEGAAKPKRARSQ